MSDPNNHNDQWASRHWVSLQSCQSSSKRWSLVEWKLVKSYTINNWFDWLRLLTFQSLPRLKMEVSCAFTRLRNYDEKKKKCWVENSSRSMQIHFDGSSNLSRKSSVKWEFSEFMRNYYDYSLCVLSVGSAEKGNRSRKLWMLEERELLLLFIMTRLELRLSSAQTIAQIVCLHNRKEEKTNERICWGKICEKFSGTFAGTMKHEISHKNSLCVRAGIVRNPSLADPHRPTLSAWWKINIWDFSPRANCRRNRRRLLTRLSCSCDLSLLRLKWKAKMIYENCSTLNSFKKNLQNLRFFSQSRVSASQVLFSSVCSWFSLCHRLTVADAHSSQGAKNMRNLIFYEWEKTTKLSRQWQFVWQKEKSSHIKREKQAKFVVFWADIERSQTA